MTESLAAGKKAVKTYLARLHDDFGFTKEETHYDVMRATASQATFEIHETIMCLIEREIRSMKRIKASYRPHFEKTSTENIWAITMEANGYECYVLAGILGSIVTKIETARTKQLENLEAAISHFAEDVRVSLNLQGNISVKILEKVRVYTTSITFTAFPENSFDFTSENPLELMSKVEMNLKKQVCDHANK